MDSPLATLENGTCKAEIYENSLPGEFTVRYRGQDGSVLAEEPLTGVSSYRQREAEIRQRLDEVCGGQAIEPTGLSDSGEY